ncbi:MAG: SEL1-like repeat protein, partial [bacterium]
IGKHEPKTPPPAPVTAPYYYNKAIQEQQAQQLNQTQYTPLPQPINQSPEREYKSAPSQPELNDSQRTEIAQVPEETDPEVLFKLGRKHYRGDGVPKNETKAILYYKKAAKLGHAESVEFLKVLGVSIPQ